MYGKYRMLFLCVFMLCMIRLDASLLEWSNRWIDNVEYPTEVIFVPGLFQSEMSTVHYSGSYTASTGEQFVSVKPFMVMQPQYVTSCNFCEICPIGDAEYALVSMDSLSGLSYFFSYALGVREGASDSFMKVNCINPGECGTSVCSYGVDLSLLNIGQEPDIQILSDTYDQVDSNSDIVMYGFSRGSATIFNFLSTHYHNKWSKRVKGVVLGGCFDSMRHVFEEQCKWISKSKLFVDKLYNYIVRNFSSFGANRVEPIDLVELFPYDIPLLLVTSKADNIVPHACTLALYKRLKETGHDKVYLLILEKSWHSSHLFADNEMDYERYLYAVHAFYDLCGVSCIPEYAEKGERLLVRC